MDSWFRIEPRSGFESGPDVFCCALSKAGHFGYRSGEFNDGGGGGGGTLR